MNYVSVCDVDFDIKKLSKIKWISLFWCHSVILWPPHLFSLPASWIFPLWGLPFYTDQFILHSFQTLNLFSKGWCKMKFSLRLFILFFKLFHLQLKRYISVALKEYIHRHKHISPVGRAWYMQTASFVAEWDHSPMNVLCMILNYIWWWGSSSTALWEVPFHYYYCQVYSDPKW